MPHWCSMCRHTRQSQDLAHLRNLERVMISRSRRAFRAHCQCQRGVGPSLAELCLIMLIRAGYEIALECNFETPVMALLSVHPSRAQDIRTPAIISSSGRAPLSANVDEFGNLRSRTVAPAGILKLATDFVIEDSGMPDEVAPWAAEVPIAQLPEDAVSFLLGSRYCETDHM